MKDSLRTLLLAVFSVISVHMYAQSDVIEAEGLQAGSKHLFMDVHNLGGKVKLAAVAQAHTRDLAVQDKYGVQFLKYWVDEKKWTDFLPCISQ